MKMSAWAQETGLVSTTPKGTAGMAYSHGTKEPTQDSGHSGTSHPREKLVGGWQFTMGQIMQTQHAKPHLTMLHKFCRSQNYLFSDLHFTSQGTKFPYEILSMLQHWTQSHPRFVPVHCKTMQPAPRENFQS